MGADPPSPRLRRGRQRDALYQLHPLFHRLGLRLAGLLFGALFQRCFATELDASLVIDADAFYPDHVANVCNVFGSFHPEVGQLGNVHEPVPAWEYFDKRSKLFYGNDTALIGLADLDLARHPADDFLRPCHRFAAGRVNVHRAIVLDVNLGAGLGHNSLDRFAARSDEGADFLGINFDRLDPGRVFRKFRARFVDRAAHDAENFRARFFCATDRFRHDLVAHTPKFQIKLKAGDTVIGAAKFEIHVSEVVFRADDVSEKFVTF